MTYTPDLTTGRPLLINLTEDSALAACVGYDATGTTYWTLHVIQDSTGGRSLTPDESYRFVGSFGDADSPESTQTVVDCVTDKLGVTLVTRISSGLPLW